MTALRAYQRKRIARDGESTRRVLLNCISWESYKTMCDAVSERHIFMTYDDGTLEIMVLSFVHERYTAKLTLLFQLLARHFRTNYSGCGSFTQRREDLQKALEADQSFYVKSWPRVRGTRNIDLQKDPPPDLVFEIDVEHSCMDRVRILEAMGVPEVWYFDGKRLTVLVLKRHKYEPDERSPTFPTIPMARLVKFLDLERDESDLGTWKRFETWLRKLSPKRDKRHDSPVE